MGFVQEIDRLRGLAIVVVVLSHALVISYDTHAGLAVLSALRGATWIFIFVAGYLMAHLRDRYSLRAYFDSKLKNVIAPYLLIVSIIVLAGLPREPGAGHLSHYLFGHSASLPLWFVPMIALFYLAFPLYRWLCDRPRVLLACAASACLIAWAMGRPAVEGHPLWQFVYFQSAYLVGAAWSVNREAFDTFAKRYFVPIAMLACVGAAMSVGHFAENRANQFLSMAPLTAVLMIALQSESPLDPVWRWLAPKSFGIFFLHGIITDRLVSLLGVKVPVLSAILIALAFTALCGLVVQVAQMSLGRHSRLLVGS